MEKLLSFSIFFLVEYMLFFLFIHYEDFLTHCVNAFEGS